MLPKELSPRQFSEKANDTHMAFGGIHQAFINWYPSEFQYKGHTFKSIDQVYQWEKATRANDARVAKKLLYTTNPRVAKSLGRSIKGLSAVNWVKDKNNVMKELVRIKFSDNPELLTLYSALYTFVYTKSNTSPHSIQHAHNISYLLHQ